MKKIILIPIVLFFISSLFIILKNQEEKSADKQNISSTKEVERETDTFDKSKHSIDDPASIWVIVNKKRPLPASYTPSELAYVGGAQLRTEAVTSLNKLISDAKANGTPLSVLSGYRSYEYQRNLYSSYVSSDGVENADRYSARPGHSEHQTGLAADLGNGTCDLNECFGNTNAGKWLAENAHKYGFIIRYGQGQESLTGYQYEPWHLRYVGNELSVELARSGQTMEQFFGLEPATSY